MSGPKQVIRGRFRPCIEPLEDRQVPAGMFVSGAGAIQAAGQPDVSVIATVGPSANSALNGAQFSVFGGDTRVALGDVNGDGTDDIIAAAGFGNMAVVDIFDGASAVRGQAQLISQFTAYAKFQGGVFVAAADLNGDGRDEVITTPGLGGRGHLKIWDFSDASGNFLGSAPTVLTSAYIYNDYNGEVRVATLNTGTQTMVVTASGPGTEGDVRLFQNANLIGKVPDKTPIDPQFLAAQLVPFPKYTGGLSVAAADTDGDGTDELVVSQNSPTSASTSSLIDVFDVTSVLNNYATGQTKTTPLATFVPFTGFKGQVRLGVADVDGDGKDEILATTGVSGNLNGTPLRAFQRNASGQFAAISSYFVSTSATGAWLSGKDFELSKDITSFMVLDDQTSQLPAQFGDNTGSINGLADPGDVSVSLQNSGANSEDVTGANRPFRDAEVSFEFEHPISSQAVVSLVYTSGSGLTSQMVLFNGAAAGRNPVMAGMGVTITDQATAGIPGGTAGQMLTGRYRADGGSIANFINGLSDRSGTFSLLFEDSTPDTAVGTVSVAPMIRLLY